MSRVLFTGGPIITFDGTVATALAVDGDRIVAIGNDALDWTASFDEVVQLSGRPLLPAFRDGHAHPMHAGMNRRALDLTGVDSLAEVLARVREWAAAHPHDAWIVGHCYAPTVLPGGMGLAEWLDTACADRPVVMYPTDYHALWANSAALAVGDLTASTPEPALGTIVRHADGTPTGMLLEHGAMGLVERHLPATDAATYAAGLDEAMRCLSSEGIVWAQDASLSLAELAVYTDGALGAATPRLQRSTQRAGGRPGNGTVGSGRHDQVLRRRRDRGRHGLPARAVRRRGAHLRPAQLVGRRLEGSGARVRRRRLPDPHPRHR